MMFGPNVLALMSNEDNDDGDEPMFGPRKIEGLKEYF